MSTPLLVDPLRSLPGYQLRRASTAAMGALGRALATLDLRPGEASALVIIDHNPGVAQSDLGRLLGIASGNLVPMITKLEKRGLLERQQTDGRSLSLTLSSSGARLAKRTLEKMQAHETALLERIPEPLRADFLAGLTALLNSDCGPLP